MLSSLKNTDLLESVTGLDSQDCSLNEDMEWVFSEGIAKVVEKLFVESSFYVVVDKHHVISF